jgi:hypothetical protein
MVAVVRKFLRRCVGAEIKPACQLAPVAASFVDRGCLEREKTSHDQKVESICGGLSVKLDMECRSKNNS